jgi:MFS family permease
MARSQSAPAILWAQVGGLAALQGAITLTWVIYNLYLVDLLTRLGFPQALATGLLIIENLLAMVMEPLMGSFSDRLQHQVGTRFPLISLGVIVAAGCFLAIPTGLFWGQGPLLRWLLPLIMVAWALAMTVFRSPAMSLLGRYAFATHLPQAASMLTLVGGLAGAAGPLANQFILGLGPLVAFAIGSGVLLLASVALGQFRPNATVGSQGRPGTGTPTATTPLDLSNLGLIFGAGVGIALGFRLVMTTFPTILKQNVTAIAPPLVMGLIFIALAVTAMPAGWWATRLGNNRAMLVGLALLVLLTAVMNGVSSVALSLTLAVGLGGALSLVFNGTLPFALGLVPAEKAGLGIGLYFSGGALATCLFASWLTGDHLPPQGKVLLAALAFLLAALCVGVAAKR